MTVRLSMYEEQVLQLYLSRLKCKGGVRLYELSFASGDAKRAGNVKVARMALPGDSGTSFWFSGTLGAGEKQRGPNAHEHQFVGIYDSSSFELTEMVASAYHYDRFVRVLGYGHTFPLARGLSLRASGYVYVLVLDAAVYAPLGELGGRIAGIRTTFFGVVPINSEELEIKKSEGLLSLMGKWDDEERDILRVAI